MVDTPYFITALCDADYCTKSRFAQMGRDAFTVADLEEMKREEEE